MFRVFNVLLAALFLFGAVLQYNDPDPLRWMAICGAAAACCVMAALGRLRWPLPAVVALAWAATLAPDVIGEVGVGEMSR